MKRSELISIRDTIQSIWVAIVLAFVLRAFMLEAFVIPTGSMAPRLMGRHVLVKCRDCKYEFPRGADQMRPGSSVVAVCPNCGEENSILGAPIKGGDRVLVLKLPRQFRPLKRWDVVVFKDPQGNSQNYIKRLIGLPGEVLRIVHGDIFVHPLIDRNDDGTLDERDVDAPLADLEQWQIARKPHDAQNAMWQLLFDNDYQPALKPQRETPWDPMWETSEDDAAWKLDLQYGRVFAYDGSKPADLRFARGRREVFKAINAYNAPTARRAQRGSDDDVCSDLKLETTVLPQSDTGRLRLTLSSFYNEFAGEINFDGRIRLLRRELGPNGEPTGSWEGAEEWASAQREAFKPGRAVEVALTHADWKVSLLIDGEPVLVSPDQLYRPDMKMLEQAMEVRKFVPVPRVGIGGLDGKFHLWHTRVMRDVFYTHATLVFDEGFNPEQDYARKYFADDKYGPAAIAGQPGWGTRENPIALRKFQDTSDLDEFFMLGDNSPSSRDSRRWVMASPTLRLFDTSGNPQYRLGTVPRYNLIGKAFFVYWPAGTPLPKVGGLPIVPNVGKMRRIN